MSESVPSSITAFAHARSRADSTASFTYMQESEESSEWAEEEAISDQVDEEPPEPNGEYETASLSRPMSLEPRKSSGYSRKSVEHPLLQRHTSARTDTSYFGRGGRTDQKIYIVTEDLTIVVSGFATSLVGYVAYISLCCLTCGVVYLVLRWLPRWKVQLIGEHRPLRECSWVVIENQWSEFEVHNLAKEQYGHAVSTVFGLTEKNGYVDMDEDDDPVMPALHFLDYRYMRFCFHPLKDKFMLSSNWKDPSWSNVRSMRAGLDSDERYRREQIFGKNQIDIKHKSVLQLLIDEAFHPFYVFQLCSLILWSLDEYYYYAVCIFLISVVSITTTLLETRSTMQKLREISRFECDVRVIRSGFCESVPVAKTPASNESLRVLDLGSSPIHPEAARNFLFGGTKIIRARRPQNGTDEEAVALALVARTGFNTTKGALVRSMLFPKPSGFKFYKDAFRYISVMAAVAGVGFIASLVNFIRLKLAWHLIVVRALDLITIVVPPALPATLTIGTNFALSRLKTKSIFCISPQRVNVGGKLDVVCFDKTGTLTEDGLDVLGVRVVQRPDMRFSDLFNNGTTLLPGAAYERDPTVDYDVHKAVLQTMASCHSLRNVEGKLVGDPLDLKMFGFTDWSFKEGSHDPFSVQDEEPGPQDYSSVKPPLGLEFDLDDRGQPKKVSRLHEEEYLRLTFLQNIAIQLHIVRGFEFVSQLRRASVIVFQAGNTFYTHRGFRVIACATKRVPYDWASLQRMERDETERGLDFIGFIIFENKLKPVTAETIEELEQAGIRQVMCTGDNILTAISVARECSLIDRAAHCFVPRFVEGALLMLVAMIQMLVASQVFARMSPDEKHELVEKLRIIDYCCGFCGDGANDCGALKAADVGISLSEAEASVAAPFTSRVFDISCVPEVIRYVKRRVRRGSEMTEWDHSEGRAALVTSFCCFKYMSLYSAIQFTSVSFLYASASNLGDFQVSS
ncbi:MAG: hypothetical protein Q9179_001034 [Wetmoreana sp. 5 TL-2023]